MAHVWTWVLVVLLILSSCLSMARLVFNDAYLEIRSMLEVNLLHRFLHTEGFRNIPSVDTPEPVSAGEP